MEDRRTQHTLDALADLYLTGVRTEPVDVPAPAQTTSNAPTDAGAQASTQPSHAPNSDHPADHPLHGPPPFKLQPQPLGDRDAGPQVAPSPAIVDEPSRAAPPHPITETGVDGAGHEPLTPAETVALLGETPPPRSPEPADGSLDGQPTGPRDPITVMTEAVVVGNLPGPSGAWVSQYAQSLAEHEGSVVLVHLDSNEIDLELVRPRDDASEPRQATPRRPLQSANGSPAPPTPPPDPMALLDEAIHHPDHPARSVLVRIDPSTDLDDLARLADLDAWTLATGPDNIATAAAVQLIDRLLATYPEAADTALGLMVLGADQPAALEAANRIAAQVGPRLAHPVELLGYQKQMLPVRITQLGRAPAGADTWTRLLDWLEQHAPNDRDALASPPIAAAAPKPEPIPANLPEPSPDSATDFTPEPVDVQADPPPRHRPDRRPAAIPPTQHATLDTVESRRETIRRRWLDRLPPTPTRSAPPDDDAPPPPSAQPMSPTPAVEPTVAAPRPVQPTPEPTETEPAQAEPVAPTAPVAAPPRATPPPAMPDPRPRKPRIAQTPAPQAAEPRPAATPRPALDTPDLAALLAEREPAFAGYIDLEARCPRHPDTQLLLDQDGQLHLLARHDSTDPAGPDLDATLVALLETRQWAIEHHAILALTRRQARFDRAAAPDIHLFTDDARAATRLADRVGPMLRLHLLQPVTVGRDTAWFCTPLS